MREAFAQQKLSWAPLTAQELTDILVYLQNLPETRNVSRDFKFSGLEGGAALFQSKGCAGCHTGGLALEKRLRNQTLTQIAVDMWNHEPTMKARMKGEPPTLTEPEMRQILAYIWARQYFQGTGSADRGKRVFTEKTAPPATTIRPAALPTWPKARTPIPISPWSRRSGTTARACWIA